MLYSYYFVDAIVEKLEKLGLKLEEDGYDFIDIFELGDEETEESTGEYLLHIDKVEIHTPESLAAQKRRISKARRRIRNRNLRRLGIRRSRRRRRRRRRCHKDDNIIAYGETIG